MEPLIQFNTSRTSIIYQLPSDLAAAKKRIEFGQPRSLRRSPFVWMVIRLFALHDARLMRRKMCVHVFVSERHHLAVPGFGQSVRLCVGEFCSRFKKSDEKRIE